MYTRWLYSHINNPTKNIEVRRYECSHYYVREFITSPSGAYVFNVSSFHKIKKNDLIALLEYYALFACDVIERISHNENK